MTIHQLHQALKELEEEDAQAKIDLLKVDPCHWSKAYFDTYSKCDMVDNNLCEEFNYSIIKARLWQLSGIPCPHVICVLYIREERIKDYVLEWYTKERYFKLYDNVIEPLNGDLLWPMTGKQPILPPESKKLLDRPKKNRRKEMDERTTTTTKRSRNGRIMTCNVCKVTGHNARTCTKSKASTVDNANAQRDSSTRQKTKQQHKGSGKRWHKKTPIEGYGVYIDTDTGMTTYNVREEGPLIQPGTPHSCMIRRMMGDEHLVGSSQIASNNTTYGNDHVSQSSRM
ncbi:hypothetical protein Pint_11033 [Pistacia integerrima]|uniref:Uncharacterized protein n=1 Tax=Pistacia integerrima TaxID=434235 RepID=A0ACC0XE75_9ROSI|nr:hypothetical protein Pint_11033 [Pistacia integerrima]